jgi:hypothetical protein
LEHQALNGSYRQGFISCVEHIPNLIAEIKERPKVEQPFGSLVQQPPDPKSLSLAPKPEKK